MGQISGPSELWFLQMLRNMQKQITALSTQQQYSVANPSTGQSIVVMGVFPGTPVTYGLQIFDEADPPNLRAEIGAFTNGDFGVLVSDVLGNSSEVLPLSSDYVPGLLSTSSATPVSIAGSPSVVTVTGASGNVLVEVGSFIGLGTAGTTAEVYLLANGSIVASQIIGLSSSATTAGNVFSKRNWLQWTGSALSANTEYTFTLQYACTGGGTGNFSANYLGVTPI